MQTGKRLVFRSEPPQRRQKENKGKDIQDKEEEEKLYFFSWSPHISTVDVTVFVIRGFFRVFEESVLKKIVFLIINVLATFFYIVLL